MKEKKTLESFLRDKLESEIQAFGDGNTEFHTRDLEQLIHILDGKDDQIQELKKQLEEQTSPMALPTEEIIKAKLRNLYRKYDGSHHYKLLDAIQDYILELAGQTKKAISPSADLKKATTCCCQKNHSYGFIAGEDYVFEHRAFSIGVLHSEQETWYNFHETTSPDYLSSTDFHKYFKFK